MSLVNKKVVHNTFGEGKIVSYDDAYIKINFKSGTKKFIFPDVFKKYIKLLDESGKKIVKKKLKEEEARKRKKELKLEKERELARERQRILEQKKRIKRGRIHPALQSVFWCEEGEEERIFSNWEVYIGSIKSGKRKGEPRRLARMNQNSACLITRRDTNMEEKDRYVLGVFLVKEGFHGRQCEDGYIKAHPKYRIRLTDRESRKILFWNYYKNKKHPKRITWNSGRQRYFDNIWMAQILKDIRDIKKDPRERQSVEEFLKHFCTINRIEENMIPEAKGALKQQELDQ